MQKWRQHDKMAEFCNSCQFQVVEDDLKLFCDIFHSNLIVRCNHNIKHIHYKKLFGQKVRLISNQGWIYWATRTSHAPMTPLLGCSVLNTSGYPKSAACWLITKTRCKLVWRPSCMFHGLVHLERIASSTVNCHWHRWLASLWCLVCPPLGRACIWMRRKDILHTLLFFAARPKNTVCLNFDDYLLFIATKPCMYYYIIWTIIACGIIIFTRRSLS